MRPGARVPPRAAAAAMDQPWPGQPACQSFERAPERDRQDHDAELQDGARGGLKAHGQVGRLNQRNSRAANVGGVVGPSTIAMSTTDRAYASTAYTGRRICG